MVKVSVILPVYNCEKYLEKCLDSLVNQTLLDIEIVCVNDGSTDNSLNILEKYARLDNRVIIISQENKKQGAARNRGMAAACGEYVGFVDADDWVDLDYYEKLYMAAKKYDSDIALAANIRIGHGRTKKRLNISLEKFVTKLQDKIDICNQPENPCPTNKIYKMSMLRNYGITWPEGCYCEDKLFTIKAVYYANGITAVPGVSYYYYRNPDSTVKKQTRKLEARKGKLKANREVLEFLKQHNADIRDKDFWAVIEEKSLFGVAYYRVQESLHTIRTMLLGIKINEKQIKEDK